MSNVCPVRTVSGVEYQCSAGHVLAGGHLTRECRPSGHWSGSVPLCSKFVLNLSLHSLVHSGSQITPIVPTEVLDFSQCCAGPDLSHGGVADQSQVLWSYGPALAVDGREETCSYTTTTEEGRWWRVRLGSTISVGQVTVTLATPPDQVVVYLVSGDQVRHCHPLQTAGDQPPSGLTDRVSLVTDCTGLKGDSLVVKDLRSADDYFGVCEVEILRFQEILSCGVPDSPAHGSVVVTGGGYTAHYTCAVGHELRGKQQVGRK